MRWLGWVVVLLWVSGCRLLERGDKQVNPPVQSYLLAEDQVLPNGIVGNAYDAVIFASGGTLPYSWTAADDAILPVGLEVSTDGHIVGVPAEGGEFTFAVLINDSAGRENRVNVTISISVQPLVLQCDGTVSGRFTGSAFTPEGPDLTDLDNVVWLAVQVPTELTTRIDLNFQNGAVSVLYVQQAGLEVGSGDLDRDYAAFYLNPGYLEQTVALDAGTSPSLTGYLTQPTIPMVLMAQSSGDWELTVECSDGPVFVQLAQYPTLLGDELQLDYDIYGSNDGVRIWTDDPYRSGWCGTRPPGWSPGPRWRLAPGSSRSTPRLPTGGPAASGRSSVCTRSKTSSVVTSSI
jgi:Putative Ig domain